MNEYLLQLCAVVSIISAFVRKGNFNRIFSLFMASIFIALMIYTDLGKAFIIIIISFVINLMLLLTCKEYEQK